jgi:hypothetical protein
LMGSFAVGNLKPSSALPVVGSFDCEAASRSEAATPLRMTPPRATNLQTDVST